MKEKSCPVCNVIMTKTGKNGRTEHHLFFPKKGQKNNVKLVICRECHNSFNETVKGMTRITNKDCLVLFVSFCRSKGKDAYAIYQQLKGVVL